MTYHTKEEYLGAIFKLKILAGNKTPIISNSHYRILNLGICSRDIFADNTKCRTRSQFCPLDLDKTTKEEAYGCYSRCAYYTYRFSNEQIHKLIEDFKVKD